MEVKSILLLYNLFIHPISVESYKGESQNLFHALILTLTIRQHKHLEKKHAETFYVEHVEDSQ